MKKVIPFVFLCLPLLSAAHTFSPQDSLGNRKMNGKLFIEHRVEKSEGLNAICRRYKVKKEDVLQANQGMTESLALGQIILIPYTKPPVHSPKISPNESHAEADAEKAPAEHISTDRNKRPESHIVKPGETLYHIALTYGLNENDLKKWNRLTDNALKVGQSLSLSAPASTAVLNPLPIKKDSVKNGPATSAKLNEPHPMAGSVGIKEKEEQGMARWFIDDELAGGRLLALHKTAPVGTIIKVVNRMTNKSVFVRVVGVLPDTDENRNTLIKISRSTAEKIGMRDEQAQVKLCYAVE